MIMPALRNRPWLTVFGALLISMGLLVSNASATFQGTASAAHAITVASMSITVGTNNVTTGSTTIAPGDTIDRVIDLTAAGTASMFNGWTLTVTASPGTSNLYTQCAAACASKGLRVTVDAVQRRMDGHRCRDRVYVQRLDEFRFVDHGCERHLGREPEQHEQLRDQPIANSHDVPWRQHRRRHQLPARRFGRRRHRDVHVPRCPASRHGEVI